jgi:hypothetical protein
MGDAKKNITVYMHCYNREMLMKNGYNNVKIIIKNN